MGKVIGAGFACLDQLLLWRDASSPVVGNDLVDFDCQGGGLVATALVASSRLGAPSEFWGIVGEDWTGDLISSGLRDEGVDISQVVRVPGGSGPMVIVCVDQATGERHFFSAMPRLRYDGEVGDLVRLQDAACVLIDCLYPTIALRAAKEARRLNVPVVFDGYPRHDDATRELLEQVDYAIAPESCVPGLAGSDDLRRACEALREMGPSHAAITRGARGLVALSSEGYIEMPAFDVDVVDTTGAGDTLHGAFCFGLTEGYGFEDNLVFSSAVAAMKCHRIGGRAGIPRLPEVQAFLRERRSSHPHPIGAALLT